MWACACPGCPAGVLPLPRAPPFLPSTLPRGGGDPGASPPAAGTPPSCCLSLCVPGRAMAEADGPTRLLEVCGQRFSRFLHNAKHKHLAWLREVEEQGMRLLESFGAEPTLMPKTPSQRRRSKKRQSSCLKEENKEPNRRRLSRRRSNVKPTTSKLSSQRRQSKEQPQYPGCQGEEVAVPDCTVGSEAGVKIELPGPSGKGLMEVQDPMEKVSCQDSLWDANSSSTAHAEQPSPRGDAGTEHAGDASRSTTVPAAWAALEEEEQPLKRTVRTSAARAARNGNSATLQGDQSPQGLEEVLFQDSDSKMTTARSKAHCCSGRRSIAGGSHKSRRASLAEKYSLASKRESMIRRSVSRAILKKAVAQASSSASSRVSCQSSLEVFVEEDVTSSTRPEPELDPPGGKAPEDTLASSKSTRAANPPASPLAPSEQQAGSNKGSCVNPTSEAQNENQRQPHYVKAWENRSGVWTRSYKQAMGALWNGQQSGAHTLSPVDEKQNSSNQAPPSFSSASKVVRPLKNFLQAVQQNQLLASPGPSGRGGVIKNFIKRNTPSRPGLKGDFVEKERQRLESLRRKQEAEEERRKKVEEEKRRRQAEMKQRREERLRKALQARERVEQLEEEKKKKRMEQKILQNDEKVHLSQGREEKIPEERSKKKLSKKHREADAQKQKAPKVEEGELEHQEPLQKSREDEVKEKGKRVWELRSLAEQQQQAEQGKERDHKQREKKGPQPQLESAVPAEKNRKEASLKMLQQQPGQEKRAKQPESIAVASNPWLKAAKEEGGLREPLQELGEGKKMKQPEALTASGTWLSKTVQKSISASCSGPPKGTEEPRSPTVNENNYGMDLKSDDSTDDENDPRKPVPAWADGPQLNQAIIHQYYHPVNVDQLFGLIPSPKLEDIFGKSKPRYFKRTSSAVWHSPPGSLSTFGPSCYISS
ncbi:inner centromere protein-like isoform X2 [Cuculus canorus]|uniref:inner centromere protein-like isoform X2 n=1 Tax=Cuculus canorus TaxID=55661 RepID=UPI0023AB2080|nr:inner centromere protein-like isoform X2 [Cuculus canorus]